MTWATGRRLLILGSIAAVLIVAIGVIAYLALHKAPSCFDGKQNQTEEGIDCGGSCAYLCTASQLTPLVSLKRAVTSGERTDVVAVIENRNQNALARDVAYSIKVYSPAPELTLLGSSSGTIDLPPGERVPLFVPGVYAGASPVDQVFVEFDESSINWVRTQGARILPTGALSRQSGTVDAPRITGTVMNRTAKDIRSLPVVAVVYDQAGVVIASSRTVIPLLPAQGSADTLFTWTTPFVSEPGKIDILPALPL